MSYAPYRGGFKLQWRELHETADGVVRKRISGGALATPAEWLPRTGPRVELRRWKARDAEVVRHWHRPGHAWHRLNGPYFEPATNESADALADRIRDRVAAWQTDGRGRLPRDEDPTRRRCRGGETRRATRSRRWRRCGRRWRMCRRWTTLSGSRSEGPA